MVAVKLGTIPLVILAGQTDIANVVECRGCAIGENPVSHLECDGQRRDRTADAGPFRTQTIT